jgi:hypothetical protein
MVKLVDLEKKNSRIIYIYIFIKFLTNIKKKIISHQLPYFDEKSSSFALTYCFVLLDFSVRVWEERERDNSQERKWIKLKSKGRELNWKAYYTEV